MSLRSGESFAYNSADVQKAGMHITGYSVYQGTPIVSYLGLFIVALFLFSYALWHFTRKKRVSMLSKGMDGRFIHLNDLSR